MAKQQQFKTWDQYTEEAALDPFELPTKDETLIFQAPSGVALMRYMQGLRTGDMELMLRSIAGDQWDALVELLGSASHKALPALVEDMADHFDLYEEVTLIGPGGGKVKAKKPREIQALLNQGYRPAGEAHAS